MVAEGNEAPGLAYIAPYAATSVAEFFMESGRDVLIVYDDLTQQRGATVNSRSSCAGPRDVRHFPATSSISIRACSNARPI